jgi:hypothetical protein
MNPHQTVLAQFHPFLAQRFIIETVHGEKALESPYLAALRTSFDVSVDYRDVSLYRKMR